MTIITISDSKELQERLESDILVIVDFFASWCSPCHAVGNLLLDQSNIHKNVSFIRLNLDGNDDLSQKLNINALPTFFFYFKGEKVDEMIGNDLRTLKSKIYNHSQLDKPTEPLPATPPPQPLSDANSSEKYRLSSHSIAKSHSSDDEKVSTLKTTDQKRSEEIHYPTGSR